MKDYLNKLFSGNSLGQDEAQRAMDELISGKVSPEEVGAFLGALRAKGESIDEIVGCAKSLRAHAVPLPVKRKDLIDTCGTGGDGANTFNISTTVAFIAAAGGLGVCKHGNRSISSQCGSADVLEDLGVSIDLAPERAAAAIDEFGFAFLFAPKFHPAMGKVASIRRNLKARTIFNLLGPLVNPALTKRQVIGVYDVSMLVPFAHVLKNLGSEDVMLVTGGDGLDEITTTTSTTVAHLSGGAVKEYQINPEDFGIALASPAALVGGDKKQNAAIIDGILSGREQGARRDIVLLNAGAALYVGGKAGDLKSGIELAATLIDRGEAYKILESARRFK